LAKVTIGLYNDGLVHTLVRYHK